MPRGEYIELAGCREHNLKDVSVSIPKERLVVLAGPAGSGKNALAFATLAAECARQWQASLPLAWRRALPSIRRPKAASIRNVTPAITVQGARPEDLPGASVGQATEAEPRLKALYELAGETPEGSQERFLQGLALGEAMAMQAQDLAFFLRTLSLPEDAEARDLARELARTAKLLTDAGLAYLSLDRQADTLSGGEARRLQLVRHMASTLSGVTYILDAPTFGLHPYDAARMARLLCRLRDRGNTVVVSEHRRQTIEAADQIIEFGPGAGRRGGGVIFQGTLEDLKRAGTPTARWLAENISVNPAPRAWTATLDVRGASRHNLKRIDVSFPKGVLTAVAGVAGSGKSTLCSLELPAQHPECLVLPKRPPAQDLRITVGAHAGVLEAMAGHYAQASGKDRACFLPLAPASVRSSKQDAGQVPGLPRRFPHAPGRSVEEIDWNDEAAGFTLGDKTMAEAMALTVEEAPEFFGDPAMAEKLAPLAEAGLGYLALGQPLASLSQAEYQRLVLAGMLDCRDAVLVLDEPCQELDAEGVRRLTGLFRRLCAQNCTCIVIEHRLEFVAMADWVLDMGPEGGNRGGEILFAGTPGDLLGCENSFTAEHLRSQRFV